MPHLPADWSSVGHDLSRRSFLHGVAGGVIGGMSSVALANSSGSGRVRSGRQAKQIIMIFLAGGPSQIDLWDPKPEAPVEYRNIHPACATSVPGTWISENLPRMAARMHQVSLVRSLTHDGPATHAAGQQLLMTGRCFHHNQTAPYFGSVVSELMGHDGEMPANVVLGGRLGVDFVADGDGQCSMGVGKRHAPCFAVESSRLSQSLDVERESWSVQRQYGFHDLGRMCLQARRLIERGTRVVTINQFGAVLDEITWDMHANGGRLNSTAADYRDTLCPQLDQALCGLLDDLSDRGLLSETVVAVSGEMGRTPRINPYGGRDHHTGAWSALLAGGPIQPGAVVGSTDAFGGLPVTRPVSPAEFGGTLYHAVGFDPRQSVDMTPISELF